jgi:putative endonuclease
MRTYFVYVMANDARVLYVGVTSRLKVRVRQHKSGEVPGFTARYRLSSLVYYDHTTDVHAAIAREKQLKRWPRDRKLRLIEGMNPEWRDLADDL